MKKHYIILCLVMTMVALPVIQVQASTETNHYNSKYVYYTVKSGNILWNIAQEYNTTVEKLVELNNIRNSYGIYVGQRLIIPVNDSTNRSYSYPLYYVYQVQEAEIDINIYNN